MVNTQLRFEDFRHDVVSLLPVPALQVSIAAEKVRWLEYQDSEDPMLQGMSRGALRLLTGLQEDILKYFNKPQSRVEHNRRLMLTPRWTYTTVTILMDGGPISDGAQDAGEQGEYHGQQAAGLNILHRVLILRLTAGKSKGEKS